MKNLSKTTRPAILKLKLSKLVKKLLLSLLKANKRVRRKAAPICYLLLKQVSRPIKFVLQSKFSHAPILMFSFYR